MRRVIAVVLLSMTSYAFADARADVTKKTVPACFSQANLDELRENLGKDMGAYEKLFTSEKCIRLKSGEDYSILDAGFDVTVISYKGKKLWVATHSLK